MKSSLIEFSHLKLGESLCADAIAAQLQLLTQYQDEAYGTSTFVLDSLSSVAQNIYNLLVYGILSQEIEELAIGLIESCEGAILPVDLDDDDADDETVFGNNSIGQ
ncbi:hypothetical protein [Nostoc sp.]|uniref:hypothetical protein n=1 Tax=Nostoc sp. TaxID=1180 RepID=UPI002FF4FD29